VEGELSHVVRHTDGRKNVQTDMKTLEVHIINFAKAFKIQLKYRHIGQGLNPIFYNSFL
jgi:hypothetical protein